MSTSCVGIMAKHWTPGEVKTRLADGIGAAPAAEFYRTCIDALLARLAGVADEQIVCYSPAEREADFAALVGDKWQLRAQVEGDLGERIRSFFAESFAAGSERVVLLGSDSPNLPVGHVQRALELLQEHRLVLGPTEDGGYYLVGAYKKTPPIFDAMPWSTPDLWPATLRQLDAEGWQRAVDYEMIPTWYDVDKLDDLRRLHRELLVESVGNEVLTKLLSGVETALVGIT